MRDELTCWDSVREKGFTGQEAALAMVGEPDTDDPAKLRKAMRPLELMRASYEGTRRWFSSAPVDADTPPRGLLVSDEMQLAQGLTDEALVEVAGDFRFLTWLCTPMADFDRQHFSRDVLARWVREVGASSLYPFAGPETSVAPVEDSVSTAPAWTVSKPLRYNGYTAPLHRLIAAAHREGKPCPTARDVVEAWRNNAPAEIAKVLPDGFDYYDTKGDTKTANLEAIRKAIGRMISARKAPARAGKRPLEPTD